MMSKTTKSEELFIKAQKLLPGGVNSPVRAFGAVGGTPRFIKKGYGPFLEDVDGNVYIDYVLSWGPLILGHAYPSVVEAIINTAQNGTSFGAPSELESELAQEIISRFPAIDKIRFVSSGTEAAMTAIRLARAHTKRSKIIKMNGGYHGHSDALLCQSGSGLATFSLPGTEGVPESATVDTLVLNYNDIDGLENLFARQGQEIAGLIMEPIAANMGFVVPSVEFLARIKFLCEKHGALFILDEVITGFRCSSGGAQALWNLEPDLSVFGKIIGGGLPVGAVGGKRVIMDNLAPLGGCYQAGTLSGNPLAMAAGLATLKALTPELISECSAKCVQLVTGIRAAAIEYQQNIQIDSVGALFGFYFLRESHDAFNPIYDFDSAKKLGHPQKYNRFFHFMLEKGVYFAPSAFEAAFMSSVHSEAEIQKTISCFEEFFKQECGI